MEITEPIKGKRKRHTAGKAKGLGLKQLFQKKYKVLDGFPDDFKRSFGELVEQVLMIISGPSGSGKSTLTMLFIKVLMKYGDVLYWSLEEGHRKSIQRRAMSELNEKEHSGKITFWDHSLTIEALIEKLKKKKSPKYVVIDSLQYATMKMEDYKLLKESFPNKGFIFISHSKGKFPLGKLACDIEYDVDIKVRMEGGVAFVRSRYGGNKPYVVNEPGAIEYWGKKKLNQFKK